MAAESTMESLEVRMARQEGAMPFLSTKEDISNLRADLRGEIGELSADLRGEIGELRAELRGEIGELRGEMKIMRWSIALLGVVLSVLMFVFR